MPALHATDAICMTNASRPARATGKAASKYKGRGGNPRRPRGTRALAARIVTAVLQGRSLDAELALQQPSLNEDDQRFLQALSYGVLRDLRRLQWLAGQLLDKPPSKSGQLIEALICVGLFQLRELRLPERAAVHSTVQAARELKLDWAANLVNAVLRRYLRESEALDAAIPTSPAIRHAHPGWLVDQIQQDWPQDWETLLEANNQPGPMWLRVNQSRNSRDEYLAQLQATGIQASASMHAPHAIRLDKPLPVSALPGFADGLVSVQDAAAQLAGPLLDCAAGQRVLDACAAPGGKTTHILELQPELHMLALDADAQRLARVEENLTRLQLEATTLAADANNVEDWWNGEPFDRILLDAPCSGSGVIRRHPDIKWLRRASDIPALAARQAALLKALWPTLAPAGKLLFATCSILQAEGDAVIQSFLATHQDAQNESLRGRWGEATNYGRRIRSGDDDMDGFFYCLLTKRSDDVA